MSADNVGEGAGRGPDDLVPRLVKAAAAGDAGAWEKLVDRFGGLLWSVCRSFGLTGEDAADIVQLTWLRLLEHLDGIRDPERLAGWLATTCRRECLALVRKGRFSVSVEPDHMDRLTGGGPAADEPLLTADEHAALWQAFQLLSDWCQRVLRELIVDAEDGAPSYRLAAVRLETPTGSLGPTRARCLRQLRKLLVSGGI